MRKIVGYALWGGMACGLLLGLAGCGENTASSGANSSHVTSSSQGSGVTSSSRTSSAATSSVDTLSGTVTASGSSALAPLATDASGRFMAIHPNVDVEVSAGGSGTGLNNVAAGTVDIGDSDVYASEKLDASTAETLVDHKVATIGVAAVVNDDVAATLTNVTTAQLISIFTGVTTNWSTLGGPNETIIRCTRPTSSGTRALFEKYAMGGTAEVSDANGLESDNSGDLYTKVQETKGAIGYLALSYLVINTDVGILSFNGTAATYANIYGGAYPVWGFEHMYTLGAGSALAQAFIGYICSDVYSGFIEQQGYGVNSKMSAAATSGR